ncbi:ABC transporter permease [Sphingomonas piscis]|uniref:ABC transporter permease n=1 Tax=Sphingomonas piscis TaxID=2714943 RepID=A0A6G7YPW0_9SPHN|nr:ABC transporter permease [Sphingomonas piscis]QIK78767.1 ABC transporter permease [Sphingomonas piscis]
MIRTVRAALVIFRRDFAATVLSKAFIFFLIGPLLPLLISGVFAGIGASTAEREGRPTVGVIATPSDFAPINEAHRRLEQALGENDLPKLIRFDPQGEPAQQSAKLLTSGNPPILAVLSTTNERPTLTGAVSADGSISRKLQLVLQAARRVPVDPLPAIQVVETGDSSGKLASARSATAHAGQFILFFLTILLAGMLLSQVIEEKSNKIIEVIAAAIPIDAMFLGKLFAMLAASVIGIMVWTGLGVAIVSVGTQRGLEALPDPAVGWALFGLLGVLYFAMNYLLLGALFLSIGAQASTPREVQTISMPVTILQVLIFGLATATIGNYGSALGIGAAIFPFSSPLVMLARAAELPELWPHLLALAWQTVWVALILRWGAGFFRSRVLKSGPKPGRRRRAAVS